MDHRPPPPFPNQSFFFQPPSFNPNSSTDPNPNFSSSFFPSPPPLQLNTPQNQPQSESPSAPLAGLPTSLSLLTSLLELSSSTLSSFSSLLSRHPLSSSSDGLSRCPFNPNHFLPPESLFLHSLHCPTPISDDVQSLLESLRYPKTLESNQHLTDQNNFAHPLTDTDADLCFSLDDYVEFGSNFFYQDCPGVVSSSADHGGNRMFSIPSVLSIECANFACNADGEGIRVCEGSIRVLPSDLWVVRCEIEQWSAFPNSYSYNLLRVLMCAETANERDLPVWVITNSPRFGVVIDPSMRDHVVVLFRLCLKVIVREAFHSHESLLKEDSGKTSLHLNPKALRFSCPKMVEGLSWLASQLSVLYGDANAKLFAIGMVKQLLLNAASNSLLCPLDLDLGKGMDNKQGSVITGSSVVVGENQGDNAGSGVLVSRPVFVYQVAAAVAALHERAMLEEKMKALRSPQQMTAYQRVAEHDYLSKKAQEERQKRENYRPIVEHDGLPVQRPSDKDENGRTKTKEQLLAEERDYKRRRMSYRGKKLKRNTKEVMRDIIEEHMEAIRQAGGIGCFDRVDDNPPSSSKTQAQEYAQSAELNISTSNEYDSGRDQRNVYKRNLNSGYSSQTTEPTDFEQRRYDQRMGDSYRGQKSSSRNRHRTDEGVYGLPKGHKSGGSGSEVDKPYSRSRSREKSHRSFRDHSRDRRKKSEEGDSYPENPPNERKYTRSRHSSRGKSEYHGDRRFEDSDRERRKSYRKDRSHTSAGDKFDDRYAPSRSPET